MNRPARDKPNSPAVRRRLLAWFARHQRPLPWRSDPTPYRVWVSEIMLQQTQVATVLPYFKRFVRRFPDVRSLASAALDDVLAAWAGLGYYSRARNLHRAAGVIVRQRDAGFPDTLAGLLALPGVGRYSAGAILSIAFDKPAPILDGNVTRVLCRLFAIGGDPKSPANQRRLWQLAQQLVAPRRPSAFNQAMMELGALVCTPRAPACRLCPLAGECTAWATGRPERFPHATRKTRVQAERWAAAVVRSGGRALLTRRAEAGRWGGLWEFPGLIVPPDDDPARSLRTMLRRKHGLTHLRLRAVGQVRHQLSHRDMTVDVFTGQLPARHTLPAPRQVRSGSRRGARPQRVSLAGGEWADLAAVAKRPVSTLTRKIARLVEEPPTADPC